MPPLDPDVAAELTGVGSMLRMAWSEVIEEIFIRLEEAGYDDLRPIHRPILRDLLALNLRPSELAARLGLSKQAANDIMRELEGKGYIALEPDPDDGRAKRIVATPRGQDAWETAYAVSTAVGERWAELVGEERYVVFAGVLREIVVAGGLLSAPPRRASEPPKRHHTPGRHPRPAGGRPSA